MLSRAGGAQKVCVRRDSGQERRFPAHTLSPTSLSRAGLCPTGGPEGSGPHTSNSTTHRAGLTGKGSWGEGRWAQPPSQVALGTSSLVFLPARIWSPSNPSSHGDLPLPVSFLPSHAAASARDQNNNQDATDMEKVRTARWPPLPRHPYVGED